MGASASGYYTTNALCFKSEDDRSPAQNWRQRGSVVPIPSRDRKGAVISTKQPTDVGRLAALFILFLRAADAQTPPDVAEILKRVSEVYKSASQYEFVIDSTDRDATLHSRFAFKSPDGD